MISQPNVLNAHFSMFLMKSVRTIWSSSEAKRSWVILSNRVVVFNDDLTPACLPVLSKLFATCKNALDTFENYNIIGPRW